MRHFGENRVQEWEGKRAALADLPATWHLIGHLQSNKAARAASIFTTSIRWTIGRWRSALTAPPRNSSAEPMRVLIEVHLGGEETKSGVAEGELPALAEKNLAARQTASGRTACAFLPFWRTRSKCARILRGLRHLRDALETRLGRRLPVLSMGMSHDFEAAIQEGATEVRVGTALFGARSYPQ